MSYYASCTPDGTIKLGAEVPEDYISLCAGSPASVLRAIYETAMFWENAVGDVVPVVPGTHCKFKSRANLIAIGRYIERVERLNQPGLTASRD